jgi:hypothetical protein
MLLCLVTVFSLVDVHKYRKLQQSEISSFVKTFLKHTFYNEINSPELEADFIACKLTAQLIPPKMCKLCIHALQCINWKKNSYFMSDVSFLT